MKRKDLLKASGISAGTMAKLTKGENVTTGVLKKICETLGCNISDIMEFVPKSDGEE
jgi:DNA-binding Xre family transcriptional regulator